MGKDPNDKVHYAVCSKGIYLMESKLKGLQEVMANLNAEIQRIQGRTLQGLIKAAIHIRRDMEATEPLIPVDTGNLRSGWISQALPKGMTQGQGPVIVIGFTAEYAPYVHEMVGANFQRPGSGAKFFEAALNRNQKKILQIIQENAKVK